MQDATLPAAAPFGRRRAVALIGGGLLTLTLAACATADGPPARGGGRGRRRDRPFWEREEQRDD